MKKGRDGERIVEAFIMARGRRAPANPVLQIRDRYRHTSKARQDRGALQPCPGEPDVGRRTIAEAPIKPTEEKKGMVRRGWKVAHYLSIAQHGVQPKMPVGCISYDGGKAGASRRNKLLPIILMP